MTQDKADNGTLNGTFLQIRVNFIGADTGGVTVNNGSYTLTPGVPQFLFSESGHNYTVELTNITYIPIEHTIAVKVCSTPSNSTNSAPPSLIINNSGVLGRIPIISGRATVSIGTWPGNLSISLPQNASNPVYLRFGSLPPSLPGPPHNYTMLVAINLSVNSSSPLSALMTLDYNCSINYTRPTPFILSSGIWKPILPFSTNLDLCSVSFAVPSDPIVSLMERNQAVLPSTTTTTIALPQTWKKPVGGVYQYIIAAFAAAIVLAALLYEMHRARRRRSMAGLIRPNSWRPVQSTTTLPPQSPTVPQDSPTNREPASTPPNPVPPSGQDPIPPKQ
jgi:hypothetical protein